MLKQTVVVLGLLLSSGCALTTHAVKPSSLGTVSRSAELLKLIDQPGPLVVETVNSADWQAQRSGLINLDHAKAKAAGLKNEPEPIQIYFHVVRHPTRGTFIVDTGIERALRDAPEKSAAEGLVRGAMNLEKMKAHMPLADWLAKESKPLTGVFLTHMHLDHIMGSPDVPKGTAFYSGPGETTATSFINWITQGTANNQLAGHEPIQEWQYSADADGRFAGVTDVFGDGSLWAIWMPGHTPGSTAYLARTEVGPVLMTGDICHTSWGWLNGVEPGSFTSDHAKNAESLNELRQLAEEHPRMMVRLGHQRLPQP